MLQVNWTVREDTPVRRLDASVGSLLHACLCLQVAAAERTAEVWVQLAGELGATPEELAAVRANTNSGTLLTASQPPVV